MNKKDMETFIVNKWTQAPVPELVFDAAASVETGPDAATVLPVSLKSARRSRRGVAAIAAAAAVVLVVAAALAVWKLPDALPALWGGTSETSTSTASTTGGKPTLPSAAGSTSSQTEAPVKEEPVIDLEAIKAEIEKSGAYEDFHIKARYVDVEGHFTRKDVLQTASFLFYMEDGMGSGGDVWYYLMIETPGEDTLQIRCLDNLGGNINVYSIRDFTGDGLDEIVLLSYGKGEDITILSVSGGVARPLFFTYEMDRDSLERNFGFTVEFFADYRAVLRNQYVDYEQIIDLSPWKEDWQDTERFEEDCLKYENVTYFWFVDGVEIDDLGEIMLTGKIQWQGAKKTIMGAAVVYISYDAEIDQFKVKKAEFRDNASIDVEEKFPTVDREALTQKEKIIFDYYDAINQTNWNRMAELYPDMKSFLSNNENHEQHHGILNVKSCRVVYLEQTEGMNADKLPYLENGRTDVEFYIVMTDCDVYQENGFFYKGINASLVVLELVDGQWVIDNAGGGESYLDSLDNPNLAAEAVRDNPYN